jgi:hypothetical protein
MNGTAGRLRPSWMAHRSPGSPSQDPAKSLGSFYATPGRASFLNAAKRSVSEHIRWEGARREPKLGSPIGYLSGLAPGLVKLQDTLARLGE